MIWISDMTQGCTWFNRTWLQFTGRDLAREIGFGWTQSIYPGDLERCMQTYTTHFDAA